jgi:hypothetical protein
MSDVLVNNILAIQPPTSSSSASSSSSSSSAAEAEEEALEQIHEQCCETIMQVPELRWFLETGLWTMHADISEVLCILGTIVSAASCSRIYS